MLRACRRRGIGILGALALGAVLFVAISIVANGGRGLGFTDSGFLRGPRAPEASVASPEPEPPVAPRDAVEADSSRAPSGAGGASDLAALREAVDRAQADLQAALDGGRPEAAEEARGDLARAQQALARARQRGGPGAP